MLGVDIAFIHGERLCGAPFPEGGLCGLSVACEKSHTAGRCGNHAVSALVGFKDGRNYTEYYLALWMHLPEMKQVGSTIEELFDNLKIEYDVEDDNSFPWEHLPEFVDFKARRTELVATVEDWSTAPLLFIPARKPTSIKSCPKAQHGC